MFGGWEISGDDFVLKGRDGVEHLLSNVGVAFGEAWFEAVKKPEQVMDYEHLSITASTGTYSDRWDL